MTMIDGIWNLTVQSPMGARDTTVQLKASGASLTGTSTGPEGSLEIADGKVAGSEITWKISITTPVSTTLQFAGAVDGDSISGKVTAGMFGSFPFSGRRA